MNIPTLTVVLGLVAGGGATGAVLSFLMERVDWFQKLSPSAKKWLVFVVSLGLPIGATLALQFVPPDVLAALEPFWKALAIGFTTWLGTQVAHKFDHEQKPTPEVTERQ